MSRLRASEPRQRDGSVDRRSPPSGSGSAALVMPALLTTTSRRPCSARQAATSAPASGSRVRSPTWPLAVTPSRRSSATRSCTRSVVAATTTAAPRRPSIRAVAKPMPLALPAPVTSTTRPVWSKGVASEPDARSAATRSATTRSARLGGEERQHGPDDGGHDDDRVEPVHDSAVTGKYVGHVLDAEVPLDERLHEVADRRGDGHPDTESDPDDPRVVEQEVDGERAGDDAQEHGTREALPRLLGADGGRHGVLAEEDARGIPADVAAHGRDEEDEETSDAVLPGEQEDGEADEERRVGGDEDAAEDVAPGSVEASGTAPEHDGQARQRPGHDETGRPVDEGRPQHDDHAHDRWDERSPDRGVPQGRPQLPDAHGHGERDEDDERLLADEQGRDDERSEADTHPDGRGQVASRAALLLLDDLLGGEAGELVERRVVGDGLERPGPAVAGLGRGCGVHGVRRGVCRHHRSSIEVTPRAARPPWP